MILKSKYLCRGVSRAVAARLCENEQRFHVGRCCLCEAIRRTAGAAGSRRTERTLSEPSHTDPGISQKNSGYLARSGPNAPECTRTVKWWIGLIRLPISMSVSNKSQPLLFVIVGRGRMFGSLRVYLSLLFHCCPWLTPMCLTCVSSCPLPILVWINPLPLPACSALTDFGLSHCWLPNPDLIWTRLLTWTELLDKLP